MLVFEKISQKEWTATNSTTEININLKPSSVTNKFHIVTDFTKRISDLHGNDFDEWFIEYLGRKGTTLLIEDIEKLKVYVDEYIDSKNIDFTQFVNRGKAKKGSILFSEAEIENIIKASGYLKLYAFLTNSRDVSIGHKNHKEVYNIIISKILESDTVFKIFNVVKSRTFRYNITDKYMWEYIKMIECKSIGVHSLEIFNFIMNAIIILCEEDKNPITYFVGVIEESVKWFLRSVYKKTVIYDDAMSTEDIHGLNQDNLKTYSYNDTLGRLKGIAYDKIYAKIDKSTPLLMKEDSHDADEKITEFQRRVMGIKFISPLSEYLIYPILSKMTNIPYSHFRTLSPEHSMVLSVYVQDLLVNSFKNEYSNMFALLNYFPVVQPAVATTYTIKNVNNTGGFIDVQNKIDNFFNFKTKILPSKLISYFIGRTSRVNFCNIFDGKQLGGIPLSKIEGDMVQFYSLMFANKIDHKFEEMKIEMIADF